MEWLPVTLGYIPLSIKSHKLGVKKNILPSPIHVYKNILLSHNRFYTLYIRKNTNKVNKSIAHHPR